MHFPEDLREPLTSSAETLLHADLFSQREQALCRLTVALSLEDNTALREAIVSAKQADVSNDEINALSALVIALHARKLSRLSSGGQSLLQVRVKPSASSCCQ